MTSTLSSQLFTPASTHDLPTTTAPTIYGPFHTPSEAAGAQVVNRSSIAALAFLAWDLTITFDDEVRYIWPPHDCFIWQVYQAVAVTLVIIAVDTILILRVFALFRNSPIVHNIIRIAFIGEVISMIIGVVLSTPHIEYNDVCLVVRVPRSFGLWLASLVFQILLFILTSYRFYSTIKGGWGRVPLVSVMMRDGTWAFFLLFFIYAGYATLIIIPHESYSGVLFGWLLAAFSFAGYRIILNLYHFGSAQQNHRSTQLPSHHTRITGTDIQFTSHRASSGPESHELTMFSPKTTRVGGRHVSTLSSISSVPEPELA
ncbi:hypothetical protein NP233_g6948 [Leucocoprinus birnbaumii]|uniref:DUF6533 domain-containing protein n=1 Tax=Leucocoprinus birnbaumii TaxID=56174 RepID=A0AAD5VQ78_9AGAR|nr:hypothetical protein NP233_g6948 [Leucocoprinus birnbaumii]